MTEKQVQEAVRSRGLSRKGKNTYTQGSKRDRVATGYSDCSSFARWCWRMVLGIDIGSYTGAQISDGDLVTTHKGGKHPELAQLRVGDLVYFWSGGSTHPQKVSHVEVVIKVGKTLNDCRLLGHGSGKGPTEKNLKDYCASRNYLMTRRPKITEKTWTLGQRIITLGCYGEDVHEMQRGLKALGYPLGTAGADWDCGDATDAAIRKFQKAYGLTVDGEFGPASLAKFRNLVDKWEPAANFDPLTEDDYAPPEDTHTGTIVNESGDAATDPDDLGDGTPTAVPSPELDGAMGASIPNPYPQPTGIKKRGSTGATVKWIQWELRQAGMSLGKYGPNKDGIDGDFGSATFNAVKKFQKNYGLLVDGEVGPKTIAALIKDIGDGSRPPTELPPAVVIDGDGRIYDVSGYDGSIDFVKVLALVGKQKCLMIIIRTQASKLDDKLARNIKGCKDHGIPYGVYAYTYAGTEAAGRADADNFYNRTIAAGGDPLCWVIDAEEGKNTKKSTEAMRKRLRERIGKSGAIWFYSYDSRVRSWADIMKNYDAIWSARWNNPDIAPGYSNYDLWQYGYTNVSGIGKNTDTSKVHPKKTLTKILAQRAA